MSMMPTTASFLAPKRILLSVLGLILLGLLALAIPHAQAQAPHIANRTYPVEQVMRVQSSLNASNGAPNQHSSVVVHQGYVVQVYSTEGPKPLAGISAYDISDPTNPKLVSQTDAKDFSEQHAIGFTQQDGRTYTAHLTVKGISIWDWTEMTNPTPVSTLTLPGISPGYTHSAWWLSWQHPYLYVSGASNGLYILDTTDLGQPRLINRENAPNPIPPSQLGGFRLGSIFAVGNLLVTSANDGLGYSTLDISDPINPALLTARLTDAPASYSSMLNGNYLYAAGIDNQLHGFDLSNPNDLRYVGSANLQGRGGYLTIQDNYAHIGASTHYMKVDISQAGDYKTIGSATSHNKEGDEDFAVAVGNLVFISDDHANGTYIVPHQTQADTLGPSANMVIPADGATNQSRSTRIGLTFTDLVDLQTITPETFIVRPLQGDALAGTYSTQTGIVNFTPAEPLSEDTTYEIIIPAGGIQDVIGNTVPTAFRSTFSTGTTIGKSLWCDINQPAATPIGQPTNFQLQLSATQEGASVRWDYGDGTPISEVPVAPVNSHTYYAPGRYSVRATITTASDATACTTRTTIYVPPIATQARNSSTIILDHSGTQVWSVNQDNNSVTVVDAVLLKKMAEIATGSQPRTLAQAPDGTIWIANQGDSTITVIDSNTRSILATIPLPRGSEPFGLVFNPTKTSAYVTLQSTGQLAEIDIAARTLKRTLDVGPTPRALVISGDGTRLFITRFISTPEQGSVIEVDPVAWQVKQRIPLVYDIGPDTEASGRGVPNGLATLAISPSGNQLWIGARKSNTARGLLRDGQSLTFESTVRSMLATVDLGNNREDYANRYDFNDRDGPIALRFSPMGDYVFALLEGVNAIDILDAYTRELITSIDNIGHAPQGMVFTADGSKLFVQSWLTRSIFVYDLTPFYSSDATSPRYLSEIKAVANDPTPPEILLGKQIFFNAGDPRMSRDSYLSCASCHFDNRDDGQVWDRTAEGEGLRNTISLIGKGSPGHGNLHWSANFDEVQDFENDIRHNFGGQGFMPDSVFYASTYSQTLGAPKAKLNAELDALAAYVNSLRELPPSPYRNADGTLTADGEAGRLIFISAGCASCHGGPQFTDSPTGLRHQVGTITHASGNRLGQPLYGLDTPTLRGLWLTAPYLHDGSATTLDAVFSTRNPLDLYGSLQSYLATNPRAIEQLVAYLLQIDDSEPAFDLPSLAIDIVAPAENSQLRRGKAVTLQVNISATMGPTAYVDYYANGQHIGKAIGPLYSLEWTPTTSGQTTLLARLVYESGAATISNPHPLTVLP